MCSVYILYNHLVGDVNKDATEPLHLIAHDLLRHSFATETCTGGASPQSVGAEGGVGVDVVMQPPLHRHVPVAHAVSHLHAEVGVVAVDVLNGSEVVRLRCGRIRADIDR